jgi:integrase
MRPYPTQTPETDQATALPVGRTESPLPAVAIERVKSYARRSRAAATVKSYRQASWLFEAWCHLHGRQPLPASAETVKAFITEMAEIGPDHRILRGDDADKRRLGDREPRPLKPASIAKLVSAIAFAHREARLSFDRQALEIDLAGIRRTHGTKPRQVKAITVDELRQIVTALPVHLQGVRDRALLLVGWAAALRRSELVGLDIGKNASGTGHIAFEKEGVRITLHRSKTDQEGCGIVKALPHGSDQGAIAALEAWLKVAGIKDGPVFRPITKGGVVGAARLTDRSVADIIKRAVRIAALRSGLGKAEAEARAKAVAGHSLRSGFATSAAVNDVTGENIARHVGWTSTAMTVRYIREADLYRNNPLHKISDGVR